MHYLTYVFIPDGAETETAVARAMRPFDANRKVRPWKRHISPGEAAAMARRYGLPRRSRKELATRMEDWTGRPGGVDERGLYEMATDNPEGRWDWYEIGGRWDGFLPDNILLASSLRRSPRLKALLPHDFITSDAVWHGRARITGSAWPPRVVEKAGRRWLKEFQDALEAHAGCRVVCVDRHL